MDKQEYLAKNAPKITEIISTPSQETSAKEAVTSYGGGLELLLISVVSIVGFYILFRASKSKSTKGNVSSG